MNENQTRLALGFSKLFHARVKEASQKHGNDHGMALAQLVVDLEFDIAMFQKALEGAD